MEKLCISCGMPLVDAADYPLGDTTKDYCRYCAREDGSLMSYEEALEMAVAYCLQDENYKTMEFKTRPTEEEARAGIAAYMATMPAWSKQK